MTSPYILEAKRLLTMLCIMIAFVFAAAATGNVLDDVQHAAHDPFAHEHIGFSAASVDYDDHDHLSQTSDGDSRSDSGVPHHHHHGDANPGLPSMGAVGAMWSGLGEKMLAVGTQTFLPGVSASGLKRPPRAITIDV